MTFATEPVDDQAEVFKLENESESESEVESEIESEVESEIESEIESEVESEIELESKPEVENPETGINYIFQPYVFA
jgi:hypothetical protein